MSNAIDDDHGAVLLPAMLDLTAAEPLQRRLLEVIRSGDSLVVCGGAVERVSTAAIQVLIAAARDVRGRGGSFHLTEPSAMLSAALIDLGVASHLCIQETSS